MTTSTLTLTDFLLARIAEDEAVAREAIAEREAVDFIEPPEVPDMAFVAWEDLAVPAVVVGPERVLAECEAKRAIVTEALDPGDDIFVRHLASVFADHPDYDEAWRP